MVEQKRHDESRSPRSPRERIARMRALAGRGLKYWKGTALALLLTGAAAIAIAAQVPRVYRSECTVFAKSRIRTDDRDESSTSPDAVARQAARLKDMLTTRSRLEGAIRKFGLYPQTVGTKTILDAVEQMKPHVGFRSLDGGQYVISFDGGDPESVRSVTQYLSESLIGDYAASDVADLEREADFLAQQEQGSLSGLETSTRALTVFLAAHPEFALEAKQAATTPFGPSPTAGIPLMPNAPSGAPATTDPELLALYRERWRLEADGKGAAAAARGLVPSGSKRQLDEQVAQARTEVEAAAKRFAETQADLAMKSNLTEDHPDMRAARMAGDAAARQLHEAKVKLLALQQLASTGPGAAPVDPAQLPPSLAERLRQVDAQIALRRSRIAKAAPAAPVASEGPPAEPRVPIVSAAVELETQWQRLLRALNEAKAHHEDLKQRLERAKLALEAAHAQANERMAIVEPPYRPTHPSKGGRSNAAIAGLIMACLLALAYATARVVLDDTLRDAEDVEALQLSPVLGVVPAYDGRPRKES